MSGVFALGAGLSSTLLCKMTTVPRALYSLPMFQRDATPALRARVLERDDHRCYYCGRLATELDHVNPFSRGGLTIESNLVAACVHCNHSKGDRTPEEWRRDQAVSALARRVAAGRTRRGRIKAAVTKRQATRPPAYLADLLHRR